MKKAVSCFFVLAFIACGCAKLNENTQQDTMQAKLNENSQQDTMQAKNTTPKVLLETSMGNITLELNPEKAPITVENFLKYVQEGHYNGTIFHRVIGDFMIQGGGYTENMSLRATKQPIKCEADNGLSNDRGAIAMARTAVVDSAASQFFINTVNNTSLNHQGDAPHLFGYAVFGQVTEGMDVVDKIQRVQTVRQGMHANLPKDPIVIRKASIIR